MPEHLEPHGMRRCLTFRYLRAEAPPGRAGDTKVVSVIVAGFGLVVVVVVVVAAVAVARISRHHSTKSGVSTDPGESMAYSPTTPTTDQQYRVAFSQKFCSNQATH